MITNISIPEIAQAYNVVRLTITADAHSSVIFHIEQLVGNVYVEQYRGSGVADAAGRAIFNIQKVLQQMVQSLDIESKDKLLYYPEMLAAYRVTATSADLQSEAQAQGVVVYGGIGNDIYRRLVQAGTNIFKQRLLNTFGNRIMTVRTESRYMSVRETELMPLRILCAETGTAIQVRPTTGGTTAVFNFNTDKKQVIGLHLANIRKWLFEQDGIIYSELQVWINGTLSCTVTITPSASNLHNRTLRFRNTYGAYEAFEVTGVMEYPPAFAEADEYRAYDPVVDDYTLERERLTANRVYKAEAGYKTPGELLALQDMLQSGDTWLVAGGLRYGCLVDADSPVLATDEFTPGTVALTIRLKDENYGIDLDVEYLLPIYESSWEDYVCKQINDVFTGVWSESDFMCRKTPEYRNIQQTNITLGAFYCAAIGQDNKLYFGSVTMGIWRRDDDAIIRQTNITTGGYRCVGMGQDSKLYFGSEGSGIWRLDDDGIIRQTNKTDRAFVSEGMGQNGKLYFGSISFGIWYLDNDGTIKQTNNTTFSPLCTGMGQNGKLYFGTEGNGIVYLDSDGAIKQTNNTTGAFRCAAVGQNGKLYFGGLNGIVYLDNDATIKPTNITSVDYRCATMGQDNKLYFGGHNDNGIWRLDDDGIIRQTGKTNGSWDIVAMGQDSKLYFGGQAGIVYLDNDIFKATNITNVSFTNVAIMGPDNHLYFGSNGGGIYYLNYVWPQNTGVAAGTILGVEKTAEGQLIQSWSFNILNQFDVTPGGVSFPAVTTAEYAALSDADLNNRIAAFYTYVTRTVGAQNSIGDDAENEPVTENIELCPV